MGSKAICILSLTLLVLTAEGRWLNEKNTEVKDGTEGSGFGKLPNIPWNNKEDDNNNQNNFFSWLNPTQKDDGNGDATSVDTDKLQDLIKSVGDLKTIDHSQFESSTAKDVAVAYDTEGKLPNISQKSKEEFKNLLIKFISSFKSAQKDDNDDKISVEVDNKLNNIIEPLSKLTTFDASQFKSRQTRDVSESDGRDLLFDITLNLNQLIKFILSYFLDDLETYIGQVVGQPIRQLLDSVLDWLLPCGVVCTVLAN